MVVMAALKFSGMGAASVAEATPVGRLVQTGLRVLTQEI